MSETQKLEDQLRCVYALASKYCDALEMIAGAVPCVDGLMSNADVARQVLIPSEVATLRGRAEREAEQAERRASADPEENPVLREPAARYDRGVLRLRRSSLWFAFDHSSFNGKPARPVAGHWLQVVTQDGNALFMNPGPLPDNFDPITDRDWLDQMERADDEMLRVMRRMRVIWWSYAGNAPWIHPSEVKDGDVFASESDVVHSNIEWSVWDGSFPEL